MENKKYLEYILSNMNDQKISLSETLYYDFLSNNLDCDNVLDLTDFLEEKCMKDMDMVAFLMSVYTGNQTDLIVLNK